MSDLHSSHLIGGTPISIPILRVMEMVQCSLTQLWSNAPKPNSYVFLVFKLHSDSDFDHKPNMLGDIAIPILIRIHFDSDSNSSHEPNAPQCWLKLLTNEKRK